MEVQVLKSGSAVVAHKGQVWLMDAPKGVGDELAALGIIPDTILTTTVAAPGIAELREGFKIIRQLPLRGDGLEAEAVQMPHGWDYIVKDDTGASFLFTQRGDASIKDVRPHDLSLVGNKYRANDFGDDVLTRPWSAAAVFVVPKVWKKLSEVPASLRKMEDSTLSLGQANAIARQADGIPEGEVEEPFAVAIANFKRTHHKAGGRWVRNKEKAIVVEETKAGAFVCPNCGSRHKSTKSEGDDPTCAACGEDMIRDRRRRTVTATVGHAASRGVLSGLAGGLKGGDEENPKEPRRNPHDEDDEDDEKDEEHKNFTEALATLKAKYPQATIEGEGHLSIFKSEGQWRWATITSAVMWDKQDELVTRKAMDFAVTLANITGERGPLRHEHVPGLDVGACDWQMRKGDFLFEAGRFDDTPFAQRCRKVYADNPGLYKVSAGLRYQSGDLVDGVYHRMAIFERSATKTPAVPLTALGVKMFEVSEDQIKQIATEMDWPVGDVQALVERASKSSNPPENLEALKSAISGGQETVAMDDLLAKLTDAQKSALREKLAPAPDSGGENTEITVLKTQVEGLTSEVAKSNEAIVALAEALKVSGTQPSLQDAVEDFLSRLPRRDAAQFAVSKGGPVGSGGDLAAIQAQLNEMSTKMDVAIKGPTFDYDAFTSRRQNPQMGGQA